MNNVKISPSLLAADFTCLGQELGRIAWAGADCLHLDIMDGIFVPEISFGSPVLSALRQITRLPFDLHLMVDAPLRHIKPLAQCGADFITFHLESSSDPVEVIEAIHSLKKEAWLSIRPGTPVTALLPYLRQVDGVLVMSVEPGYGGQSFLEGCLPKIQFLREAAPKLTISVDGGINPETACLCREAGADMLVAGTYVFRSPDPSEAIAALRGNRPKKGGCC